MSKVPFIVLISISLSFSVFSQVEFSVYVNNFKVKNPDSFEMKLIDIKNKTFDFMLIKLENIEDSNRTYELSFDLKPLKHNEEFITEGCSLKILDNNTGQNLITNHSLDSIEIKDSIILELMSKSFNRINGFDIINNNLSKLLYRNELNKKNPYILICFTSRYINITNMLYHKFLNKKKGIEWAKKRMYKKCNNKEYLLRPIYIKSVLNANTDEFNFKKIITNLSIEKMPIYEE